MDSKIILTIIIVALIGIVAATYETDNGSLMDTLTSVQTEDSPDVSDIAQVDSEGDSQNSGLVEESAVLSDNSQSQKSSGSSNRQSNGQVSSDSVTTSSGSRSSNSGSGSSSSGGNGGSNSQVNANNGNLPALNTINPKISSSQALVLASQALPSSLSGAQTQIFSTDTVDGVPYYIITASQSGEVVAELEINGNTGEVTGGAFSGEVPEPETPSASQNSSAVSSNSTNNTEN